MQSLLLVGVGGFLGAVARYKLGGAVLHLAVQQLFPWGTFAVNLLGCAAMGLLAGLAERHGFFTQPWRLFIFTGVLGGFTTFSAFGLETVTLLQRGAWPTALAYVAASVVLGLLLLWLGVVAVKTCNLVPSLN
jgi:CrcB protein